MSNKKLMTPHEAEMDKLLQVMAVLIDRLGGEVILKRREIESFFDVPVVSRVISPDYVLFRVNYPDEDEIVADIVPEEDTP